MDTCHEHEDSKSSSTDQEINQATDDDDYTGTGRSYECVFCKRGFTTAQALGGHMNIHRKDRVKAKPSTQTTRPHHEAEYYSNPSLLIYSSNPNPSTPQLFSTNFESRRIGYDHTYFAAGASGSSRPHHGYQMGGDSPVQSSPRLNPNQEEWFTSFCLHIGPGHVQDSIGKKGQGGCNGTEEELDLELRLGHDP